MAGEINASLTLDTRSFAKGLDDAQKKAQGAVSGIQSAFAQLASGNVLGGLTGSLSGLTGALGSIASGPGGWIGAAGAAVALVGKQYKELVAEGSEVIKQQAAMARQFGLTAEQAGALGAVARRFNVDQDSLNSGMSRFLRNVAEARDNANGPAGSIFRKWGVDLQQLTNGGNMAALQAFANAVQKLSPEDRIAAGRDIAGKGGQALTNMLARSGGAGLAAMQAAGTETGLFLTDEEMKRFEGAEKVVRALRAGSNEMRIRISVQLARETQGFREGFNYSLSNVWDRVMGGAGVATGVASGNSNLTRASLAPFNPMMAMASGMFEGVAGQMMAGATEGLTERQTHVAEVYEKETERLRDHIDVLGQGTRTQQELREATERQKLAAEGLSQAQLRAIDSLRSFANALQTAQGFRERAETLRQSNELAGESPLGQQIGAVRAQGGRAIGALLGQYFRNRSPESLRNLLRGSGEISSSSNELQEQLREQARNQLRRQTETPAERFRRELRDINESAGGDAGLAARGHLGVLQRAESQFGLNQPIRQAQLATSGSAAAIATINAARLQASGPQTVQERIAAVNQAALEVQRAQLEQQRQMTEIIRANGGSSPVLESIT